MNYKDEIIWHEEYSGGIDDKKFKKLMSYYNRVDRGIRGISRDSKTKIKP